MSVSPLLTPAEVAKVLSVAIPTLDRWRQHGRGPKFVKLNRGRQCVIRYRPEAVERFLQECERSSTSDPGPDPKPVRAKGKRRSVRKRGNGR